MKLALSFFAFHATNAFQSVDWNDGDKEDMGNPCGSFVQFDEPEDFGDFRKGSKLFCLKFTNLIIFFLTPAGIVTN